MKVGNIYKCKDGTSYVIIQEINEELTKYIVADNRFDYCQLEVSSTKEVIEEIVEDEDFELINQI